MFNCMLGCKHMHIFARSAHVPCTDSTSLGSATVAFNLNKLIGSLTFHHCLRFTLNISPNYVPGNFRVKCSHHVPKAENIFFNADYRVHYLAYHEVSSEVNKGD